MAAFFRTWGTELFFPDAPFDPYAVQTEVFRDGFGWGPVDAPLNMPAGSTKRNDNGCDGPFGVTTMTYRGFWL